MVICGEHGVCESSSGIDLTIFLRERSSLGMKRLSILQEEFKIF